MMTLAQASPPASASRPAPAGNEPAAGQSAIAPGVFLALLKACLPGEGGGGEETSEPGPAPHPESGQSAAQNLDNVPETALVGMMVVSPPLPSPPGDVERLSDVTLTAEAMPMDGTRLAPSPLQPDTAPRTIPATTPPPEMNTALEVTSVPEAGGGALEGEILVPGASVGQASWPQDLNAENRGLAAGAEDENRTLAEGEEGVSLPTAVEGEKNDQQTWGKKEGATGFPDKTGLPDPPGRRFTSDGISSALTPQRMVTQAEKEKLAETGLQKVPSTAPSSSPSPAALALLKAMAGGGTETRLESRGHAIVPSELLPAGNPTHPVPATTPDAPAHGLPLAASVMEAGTSAGVATHGTAFNPARMAWLATEIQDLAVELLHFKADSLAVLIRPDTGTALHLRLTVIAGRVYAEARLQSGEAGWLQTGWTDLQRVLADQNIVLEPLKYSSFHGSLERDHLGRRPEPASSISQPSETTARKEAALTPAPATPGWNKRRPTRGWEWWA